MQGKIDYRTEMLQLRQNHCRRILEIGIISNLIKIRISFFVGRAKSWTSRNEDGNAGRRNEEYKKWKHWNARHSDKCLYSSWLLGRVRWEGCLNLGVQGQPEQHCKTLSLKHHNVPCMLRKHKFLRWAGLESTWRRTVRNKSKIIKSAHFRKIPHSVLLA
jgi:hypothetical protein